METSQSCCLPAGSLRRVAVYCRAKSLSKYDINSAGWDVNPDNRQHAGVIIKGIQIFIAWWIMIADEHHDPKPSGVFLSGKKNRAAKANEASAGAAAQVANCLLAQYSRRVSGTDPVPSNYCHLTPAHETIMKSCCCYRGSRSLQMSPESSKLHSREKQWCC